MSKPIPTNRRNREDAYAVELAERLEARGAIITKGDRREIKQAFERHFRDVFASAISRQKGNAPVD